MGSLIDLPRGNDFFFESRSKLWSLPHGRGSKDHFSHKNHCFKEIYGKFHGVGT